MALPLSNLNQLRTALHSKAVQAWPGRSIEQQAGEQRAGEQRAGEQRAGEQRAGEQELRRDDVLPLGLTEFDAVLPDGGLPRGQVIEFSATLPSLTTSLSLAACAQAQKQEGFADEQEGSVYCAYVDPFSSLYAPGVAKAGVLLSRLLVVNPPLDALSRVAVRLVESQAFAVVVIDSLGLLEKAISLAKWPQIVRRLALAAATSRTTVILITDQRAYRPLPLPVAMRLELSQPEAGHLKVQVAKERHGRITMGRVVSLKSPSKARESTQGTGREKSSISTRSSTNFSAEHPRLQGASSVLWPIELAPAVEPRLVRSAG